MIDDTEFKVGDLVVVPTSHLGKLYGAGQIVAIWSDRIAVNFSGHLGHYSISSHKINHASIMGIKNVIDEMIPKNEIHIKSDQYDNRQFSIGDN